MAEDYLGELYALRVTFESINQRYFDGQSALFPENVRALSQLVEQAEKLVDFYNRDLSSDIDLLDSAAEGSDAPESETRHMIDLPGLHHQTRGASTDQAAYLVDMAKSEALEALGEPERAAQLVEKYV